MEKQLPAIFILPLREYALRRVVASLCSQTDILALIANYDSLPGCVEKSKKECFTNINSKVRSKLSKISLPESILKDVSHLIPYILQEIIRWKSFHRDIISHIDVDTTTHILKKLFWTNIGTVNYIETARRLLLCEQLGTIKHYKIACLYCFRDDIQVLWDKLSRGTKQSLDCKEDTFLFRQPELFCLWTCIMNGKADKFATFLLTNNRGSLYQQAFHFSALHGNKAAAEYFFQKLAVEEKEALCLETIKAVIKKCDSSFYNLRNICDVLFYLLSLISEEQQVEMFKEKPYSYLDCFLQWPYHELFLGIAEIVWTQLTEPEYAMLLSKSIYLGNTNPKLFLKFFLRNTENSTYFRKYFVKCDRFDYFLYKLFVAEETEIIKIIFRELGVNDKKKFLLRKSGLITCHDLIVNDKWKSLKLFVQEATQSKEDRVKLKEQFVHCFSVVNCKQLSILNIFCKFVDNMDINDSEQNWTEHDKLTEAEKQYYEKVTKRHEEMFASHSVMLGNVVI